MKEKIQEIINFHHLDKTEINEIAAAICMVDKVYGDNPQKLDFNKLVAKDSTNFRPITNSEGYVKPLPEVQYMRVICDTFLIALRGTIQEPLCNKESSRVAKALNLELKSTSEGYSDIDTCTKIFDKIYATAIDTSGDWDSLKKFSNFLEDLDRTSLLKDIYNTAVDNLRNIVLPVDISHVGKKGTPTLTYQETYNKIIEIIGVSLLDALIKEINSMCRSMEGQVHANLLCYRFIKEGKEAFPDKIGVSGHAYNASNISMPVMRKLDTIFDKNKPWNEDSRFHLMFLNFYIRNRKNTFNLDTSIDEMEKQIKHMKAVEREEQEYWNKIKSK